MFLCSALPAIWGQGGSGLNIFLSTKHSPGFGFNAEMQMADRIKVYDVRKRVDKHEHGRKACYFLSCLYRKKKLFIFG